MDKKNLDLVRTGGGTKDSPKVLEYHHTTMKQGQVLWIQGNNNNIVTRSQLSIRVNSWSGPRLKFQFIKGRDVFWEGVYSERVYTDLAQ